MCHLARDCDAKPFSKKARRGPNGKSREALATPIASFANNSYKNAAEVITMYRALFATSDFQSHFQGIGSQTCRLATARIFRVCGAIFTLFHSDNTLANGVVKRGEPYQFRAAFAGLWPLGEMTDDR